MLTTIQAAQYLKERGYQAKRTHKAPSANTIKHWCQDGKLQATKTNPGPRGVWLIPRSELDRLIGEQQRENE